MPVKPDALFATRRLSGLVRPFMPALADIQERLQPIASVLQPQRLKRAAAEVAHAERNREGNRLREDLCKRVVVEPKSQLQLLEHVGDAKVDRELGEQGGAVGQGVVLPEIRLLAGGAKMRIIGYGCSCGFRQC